jgi:hypothetical protein
MVDPFATRPVSLGLNGTENLQQSANFRYLSRFRYFKSIALCLEIG